MSSQSPHSDDADATSINEHWATISQHVINSYVEANNAVLAAMGLTPSASTASPSRDASTSTPTPVSAVAYGDEQWTTERSTDDLDELGVGDVVRFGKPITEADVSAFAQVSGDTNRLHLEDEFAEETRFGGRIAHGTLVGGTISAALARFPGTTIYLSQDLEFLAPVDIDDEVTAECEIVEMLGDDQYRVRTTVTSDDETVVDGEAVVMITDSPAADE
ncbi:MaoC family dehydratase [Halosolutus gelatinilyticus]|uniref:MaoC family dehydratase n=1 Tax=Halosolutus gelatinilyticus TaxID=2931975 RepID=UPI001FF24021|nr:MaoC family dehydratase [Halosolutus gelatinilyticus]